MGNLERLKCVKKACLETDKIFSKVVLNFKLFKSEKDVSDFILKEIIKKGLKPSFFPIVAMGKNASNPHHKPCEEWYSGFCVIDFGVRVNGYCSDMTRTVYVGTPNNKEVKLYEMLLYVQKKCISKIKVGGSCKDLDAYARTLLGEHSVNMIHSLGHGVGRLIHQLPKISSKFNYRFKEGDIVTIEPGIYVKDKFGIRIEDTISLYQGVTVLTKSSKELIVL